MWLKVNICAFVELSDSAYGFEGGYMQVLSFCKCELFFFEGGEEERGAKGRKRMSERRAFVGGMEV